MGIRTAVATGMLAAALALPLSGCFGIVGDMVDNPVDTLTDIADDAMSIADQLKDVEWGKLSRAVVYDAATGDVVAEVTDQAIIEAAFEPFGAKIGLASEPKEPEEYLIEVWQPATVKLGETAEDAEEIKILEVTTYRDSNVVALTVTPISLTLHLDTPAGTADTLRALAKQ